MTKDEIKNAINGWFTDSFGSGTAVARNTDAHNEVLAAKENLITVLSASASDAGEAQVQQPAPAPQPTPEPEEAAHE